MTKVFTFIASLFGIGYLKPAPGTWASAASAIVLYFVFPSLALPVKIVLTIIVFGMGCFVVSEAIHGKTDHDPSHIVIDEFVGMMVSCLFLAESWIAFAIALIFFRIFDIWKPWPASVIDRQKTAFAVMFDDVLMGIPALLCTELIIRFFSF